jgi:serine/threonine protein kinase/formylglycine-generating enzyme required for sulfatase activity
MSTDPSTPENDPNLSGLGRALLESKEGSKPSGPWVPPTAEELGKLLPEYDIVKMLGRGGMGAVYMGRQISLDRPVAIKILSNTLDEADASFAERFKNEARAMGKLNHPGIVAVHDFGQTSGGLLYIVMEYVEGTDVARMIAKEGRLHTDHAMAITAHVCDALGYAHDRGIIHRDIKPANIMVGYDGVVKVADFGLAKMTHSQNTGLTQSGMAMGTLHYMAPEALMLGSSVDHRADIYAVGVMLYQMLTGKIPQGMFKLPSLQIPGLDPRYDAIIAKGIMEDREARYQSVGEMRRDLDGILTQPVAKVEAEVSQAPAALPTQVRPKRPGGMPYRPPLLVQQSSGGWLAWAALAVLALGSGFFWLNSKQPRPQTQAAETRISPNPFEGVDPPDQTPSAPVVTISAEPSNPSTTQPPAVVSLPTSTSPMPPPAGVAAMTPSAASTPAAVAVSSTPPTVDVRQLPDLRTRLANYQKARHAKLSDVATRYRAALVIAQNSAPAQAAAYERAIAQSAELSSEIEKNLTSIEVTPLQSLVAVATPEPARLAELRGILSREIAGTESDLMADLDRSLSIAQTTFSKEGNLMEANAVEDYRTQLAAVLFRMVGAEPKKAVNSASLASVPGNATKDAPFVNSLGMKFVPVRITGGPKNGKTLLFSIWETRVQDFSTFVAETNSNWSKPEFCISPLHPASKVLWEDAVAFCSWLTKKEQSVGKLDSKLLYRLPTDHEWSCAAGIGSAEDFSLTPSAKDQKIKEVYPWGGVWPPPSRAGNFAGEELQSMLDAGRYPNIRDIAYGYRDDHAEAAPVGSYMPNSFGLYDMAGNVWEWCEDYWLNAGLKDRSLRGGSWAVHERSLLLSSKRHRDSTFYRRFRLDNGFRVVLELP